MRVLCLALLFILTWHASNSANSMLTQASDYDQTADTCYQSASLSCAYCCLLDKNLCTNDRSLCEPNQPDRQVHKLGIGIMFILGISIGTIGLAKLLGIFFMYPLFKKKKRREERMAGEGTCCEKFAIIMCCGCCCQCAKLQKNYRPGRFTCCGKQKPEETNSAFKASGTFFS